MLDFFNFVFSPGGLVKLSVLAGCDADVWWRRMWLLAGDQVPEFSCCLLLWGEFGLTMHSVLVAVIIRCVQFRGCEFLCITSFFSGFCLSLGMVGEGWGDLAGRRSRSRLPSLSCLIFEGGRTRSP